MAAEGVPSNSLSQESGERASQTMEVAIEGEASNRGISRAPESTMRQEH